MPSETVTDWMDALPEEQIVHQSEIVPVGDEELERSSPDESIEAFKKIEDEMLTETMTVIRDTLHFRDFDPGTKLEDMPREWIEELGEADAKKRMRVASAAWMSAKEAPVALSIAKGVMVGIVKARATERAGPRPLNVQTVVMTAPLPVFAEKEIE